MKQTIMNYILALKYSSLGNHVSTRGYLEVLENLIEDLPEENTDVAEPISATLNVNAELQELKSKLAETEESLQNMLDNESRLNKRVEQAELTFKMYENALVTVVEENIKLRDQLAKLTGPQWVD